MEFINYVVVLEGISINPTKVQLFWICSTMVYAWCANFLVGFTKFSKCLSRIIWRLCYIWHNLHERAKTFIWISHALDKFKNLKWAFISSLRSSHYSRVPTMQEFIFTIDALDFTLGSITHNKWWEISFVKHRNFSLFLDSEIRNFDFPLGQSGVISNIGIVSCLSRFFRLLL